MDVVVLKKLYESNSKKKKIQQILGDREIMSYKWVKIIIRL